MITMTETLPLLLAWLAGGGLGTFFFGGLWWTVRRTVSSPHPGRWLFGSLLLRLGLVLTGFYLVSGDHWQRLLLCLLGFVMARFMVLRLTGSPVAPCNSTTQETGHAS